MTSAEFPDVLPIFLKALDIPEFARPEFFLKAQKKSGWSKSVYLTALGEAYHYYETIFKFKAGIARKRHENENTNFNINEFSISLAELTQNKQKGELTKELLEDLHFAVRYAYKLERQRKTHTSYDILNFCERFFVFIKKEFEDQSTKTSSAYYAAERNRKKGREVEGVPEYLLYRYTIISDAPILDFNRFKIEVRKLLLTSRNLNELKIILKPFRDYANRIVDMWNDVLGPIEEPFGIYEHNQGKGIYEQKLLFFDDYTLQIWNRNVFNDKDYYREPASSFMNRDFAQFAAHIANLISSEVLKEQTTTILNEDIPISFDQLFLNRDYSEPSYEILIRNQLVDLNLNYKKGALKTAFCIWIYELKSGATPIISWQTDKVYTDLLNKKFKGLNIEASNFRKPMIRARNNFQAEFKYAISHLSQPSHVGRERH